MGLVFSKRSESVAERRKREQEQYVLQLARYGVLLPPAFGVGRVPLTACTLDRLSSMQDPSEYEYLHETDTANRILRDHMQPGLWVSAKHDELGQVRASVNMKEDDSSSKSSPGYSSAIGSLYARRSSKNLVTVLRASTDTTASSIAARGRIYNNTSMWTYLDTNGHGWLGAQVDYTHRRQSDTDTEPQGSVLYRHGPLDTEASIHDVHIKAGSWIPYRLTRTNSASAFLSEVPQSIQSLNGYVSIDFLGTTMAVEGKLPFQTLQPDVSTYFNMQLADAPPLEVTLERTSTSSALSLSQTITFDRYQLNPWEDAAPHVRNTAAWTVRLEQAQESGASSIQIGGAWQWNRGVAFKAILAPQQEDGGTLRTALLLKRWKQPRVTLSLLHKHSFATNKSSFGGIGVELETSNNGTVLDTDHDESSLYQMDERTNISSDEGVPETKAVLPGHTSKD